MRIISDFKDYYDIVLQYGIDENIKYYRKTKSIVDIDIINDIKNFISKLKPIPISYKGFSNVYIILFSGEIYIIYGLDKYNQYNECDYFISADNILEKYKDKNSNFYKEFIESKKISTYFDTYYRCEYNYNQLKYFENNLNNISKEEINNIHTLLDSPIILFRFGEYHHKLNLKDYKIYKNLAEIVVNPRLNEIEFMKNLDSYTAFQKLSQFISNILVCHPVMIKLSDEIELQKKGFDKIESFRNYKNRMK